MNFKLSHLVAATLAGSMLMGFGANAMADSTTDIVNALVSKGVLTEEEGALLTKGHADEAAGQAKALKKASKLTVSDAIDNATIYGDTRVRYEDRSGKGIATGTTVPALTPVEVDRGRARYKLTLGVKTTSGDFYSDLALAMGANGRSDNATFGTTSDNTAKAGVNGTPNDKQTAYIKRAMLGYKATDWLTLEAGRMDNPLYTTPMVWDADLTMEGFAEKFKFKAGDADLFFTALQSSYKGDRTFASIIQPGNVVTYTPTVELFAFQGGAKYAFSDTVSAKGALTYTTYSHNSSGTPFTPTANNATSFSGNTAVNDLAPIEVPVEVNWMVSNSIGVRLFGDYVKNTNGNDRFNAAVANTAAGAARNNIQAAGNDDTAWMLGVAVGSAKDLKAFEGNKMAKGDWSARLWYQDVGVYSVDQNAVDSDFMDSRVNMKGTVLKGQYNIQDNVAVNLAYGHATRKNGLLATTYSGGADISTLNLNSFDLLQLDLTYKF